MNTKLIADWISSLSFLERAKVLVFMGYRLTLYARECGADTGPLSEQKLLGINELQHKLLSQAGHYLKESEEHTYSVDDLFKALLETAKYYNLNEVLGGVLKSAQTRK
jgi:hypothetical protein